MKLSQIEALHRPFMPLPTKLERGATDDQGTCKHPSQYLYVSDGFHANGQHWKFCGCTACGEHIVNEVEA